MTEMKRRDFLNWLFKFVFGLWAAVGAYVVARFISPKRSFRYMEESKKGSIRVEDIPVGESKLLYYKERPVLLIHVKENRFVALSGICTHLRCGLNWDRDSRKLVCPCHGATFDIQGNVLSGPPPEPLTRYQVKIKGGIIYIEEPIL